MKTNQNHSTTLKHPIKSYAFNWATHIYFIGIGGIGMSALARYFVACGKKIAGYDKTSSDITKELQKLEINIHFEDGVSNIPSDYTNANTTLIIYTPAIADNHSELLYFKNHNYLILKRSQVLSEITKNTTCLAVAGTHGKTTVTSILGHLLNKCGVPVTAFLGGISENYNSNLILSGSKVTVVEADEFDRSFLTLTPDIACITSVDADHLDIYGTKDRLLTAFAEFSQKLKPGGKLIVKNGLPIKGMSCGIEDNSDYSAVEITIKDGNYNFNLQTQKKIYQNFVSHLPGRHNLFNTVIALAMAIEFGCDIDKLKDALMSYKGVKRRFSYHIKTKNRVYIDDYAHHPAEINAIHHAINEMYPKRKVLVIFQPHLFTRTRDFIDDFAESLTKFNQVLLLDIYPAREQPIEGVNSELLLRKIKHTNKQLISKSELVNKVKQTDAQVIITLGAGDIGEEVKRIKNVLSNAD